MSVHTVHWDWKQINSFKSFLVLEPLKLFGEGQYNLNEVKEMKITDSYLTLEQNVRHCQNKTEYEECTTKKYHDALREQCQCLPFNIRAEQVNYKSEKYSS